MNILRIPQQIWRELEELARGSVYSPVCDVLIFSYMFDTEPQMNHKLCYICREG